MTENKYKAKKFIFAQARILLIRILNVPIRQYMYFSVGKHFKKFKRGLVTVKRGLPLNHIQVCDAI